jgi:hypothetical protein
MAVDTDTVQGFYQQYLGRRGADENVQNWANSGMSVAEIETAIANSEEAQARAQSQQAGATTGVSRERLNQLYNELFGRNVQDAGAEYWMASGLTGEKLRDALIAGAQGSDVTSFQQTQQASAASAARSPERQAEVIKIYNELFGRNPAQAGLDYWSGINLTGEALRDQIAASAQGADASSFAGRQALLAAGQTPLGYAGNALTTGTGGTTETVPAYFQDYLNEYNAMQERLDTLTALIEQMQSSGGGYTGGTGVSVGQPGGTPTYQDPRVIDDGGVYSSVGPAYQSSQDVAAAAYNPYRTPVAGTSLTPEMLDAYRFQQFYTQAPSLVPRIDQGVGSLSYFGIPPSQIQASLSGF